MNASPNSRPSLPINSIVIEPHRREVGKLTSLAESIRTLGLLHPIAVTPSGVLVSGRHRLEACRSLGWTDIPVVRVEGDASTLTLMEAEENLCRSDLSVCERILVLRRCQQHYE